MTVDVRRYNRAAWDHQVDAKNPWTLPVSGDDIARARDGDWQVLLTNNKPVPRRWFPDDLAGCEVLGLACGGGQQGPLLAAAGARVTIVDNSPKQLARDRELARAHSLDLTAIEADMADLSQVADACFDLVFHPCSNCFVPDVRPVWREAARVLRAGGALLAGFINPIVFIFDPIAEQRGELVVRHALPYSDLTSLTESERRALLDDGREPLEFGHTLEDQIGGQLAAGLLLTDMYEDRHGGDDALSRYTPTLMATRAVKP